MSHDRIAVFFRRPGQIFLVRQGDGNWGPLTIESNAEPEDRTGKDRGRPDPIATVRDLFEPIDRDAILRAGEPVRVGGIDRHPVLVDWPDAVGEPTEAIATDTTDDHAWLSPIELRRRESVPGAWRLYDRVRPIPESIRADTTHGSAALSIWALECLRDRAGTLATSAVSEETELSEANGWEACRSLAVELLEARPSMTALANRIHRVMGSVHDGAGGETPSPRDVERAADAEIERAAEADRAAATAAAERIGGETVLTLSRSGTVSAAIERADPTVRAVYVAASRPGEEGIDVAERLADSGFEVTLHADAAIAWLLEAEPIDAVVVGADTILADGSVINKVGTQSAAIAATAASVPVYVVAAVDKIAPHTEPDLEFAPPETIYDGDRPDRPDRLTVENPIFDRTPAASVTEFLTDRGAFAPDAIDPIVEEHESLREWMEE